MWFIGVNFNQWYKCVVLSGWLLHSVAKSIYFVPFIKGIKEAILIYGDPSEYPKLGHMLTNPLKIYLSPVASQHFHFHLIYFTVLKDMSTQ